MKIIINILSFAKIIINIFVYYYNFFDLIIINKNFIFILKIWLLYYFFTIKKKNLRFFIFK